MCLSMVNSRVPGPVPPEPDPGICTNNWVEQLKVEPGKSSEHHWSLDVLHVGVKVKLKLWAQAQHWSNLNVQ